jgi:hypothetical protein
MQHNLVDQVEREKREARELSHNNGPPVGETTSRRIKAGCARREGCQARTPQPRAGTASRRKTPTSHMTSSNYLRGSLDLRTALILMARVAGRATSDYLILMARVARRATSDYLKESFRYWTAMTLKSRAAHAASSNYVTNVLKSSLALRVAPAERRRLGVQPTRRNRLRLLSHCAPTGLVGSCRDHQTEKETLQRTSRRGSSAAEGVRCEQLELYHLRAERRT